MKEFLLRMGDNTLILGHRISEWCGHSPVLEEDIALANMALDMIGQTQLWLGLAGEVAHTDADALAFRRDVWDFRNLLLVERPNGDFGHTIMRQFLFDAWHLPMLQQLAGCNTPRIAEIAAKAQKEASYHLERSTDLVIRLGDGTAKSRSLMQTALEALWPYVGEMFVLDAIDTPFAPADLRPIWDETVQATLTKATLTRPESDFAHKGGKTGLHTEDLGHLLAKMQFLQRAYPDATW